MTDAWEMHQAETGLNPGPVWRDRGVIINTLTERNQALEERVAELEGSCQKLRDDYQGALAEVERLREAYMTTANELRALASPAEDTTPEPTPEGTAAWRLRVSEGRPHHGLGPATDLSGNVQHLVSPIVGHLRLLDADAETTSTATDHQDARTSHRTARTTSTQERPTSPAPSRSNP